MTLMTRLAAGAAALALTCGAAAADPALRDPPITVASTSQRFGRPFCARIITGTVVTSSSSSTRGLVSAI